jgi:hypothetical protein
LRPATAMPVALAQDAAHGPSAPHAFFDGEAEDMPASDAEAAVPRAA